MINFEGVGISSQCHVAAYFLLTIWAYETYLELVDLSFWLFDWVKQSECQKVSGQTVKQSKYHFDCILTSQNDILTHFDQSKCQIDILTNIDFLTIQIDFLTIQIDFSTSQFDWLTSQYEILTQFDFLTSQNVILTNQFDIWLILTSQNVQLTVWLVKISQNDGLTGQNVKSQKVKQSMVILTPLTWSKSQAVKRFWPLTVWLLDCWLFD